MMPVVAPLLSHDQKSHVALHIDHLDLRNAMVPLIMPWTSCNVMDTICIMWCKCQWHHMANKCILPLTICSVLGRATARQPNIRKIPESSLYSWTMYITEKNKVLPPYANSPCHKVAHAGNSTSSFSIQPYCIAACWATADFFIC